MDKIMIFLALYLHLGIVLLTVIFIVRLKPIQKKQMLFMGFVGFLCVLLLGKIASSLFYNPRPFIVEHFIPLIPHAAENGFPSSHSLYTFFLSFLVLSFNKKWGIPLIISSSLLGIARVYVGVHHLVDIFAGMVLAAIAVYAVKFIFRNAALREG